MNPILIWITAACIFAPLSLAAPQLFPFSSLSSYFDQRARNGPGADKSAVIPQFIANAGNAVRASGGERFPRNHLPANHRPASLTDPPEQVATPVGYDIIVPHRIRQDNVNTQSAAIPLQAFLPEDIFNPPPQNQKPLVYYPEVFVKPEQPKKVEEKTPVQKPLLYYPEVFIQPEQPKLKEKTPVQKPLVYYPEVFIKAEQPQVEEKTPVEKPLVYYPEVFVKPEEPKVEEKTPVQKPLVYYPEVFVKPEEPKEEEQSPVPPSAPQQQLTPPKETQPENPPEKIAKNHAYPKKYQPEVNKKTNVKSIESLAPTVKEKREPGKQHQNSFLPAHESPRGITEQVMRTLHFKMAKHEAVEVGALQISTK